MTSRAVIIGMLTGVAIASLGYVNDSVFRLNFIVGNHFPITVFGGLVLVAAALNPLLQRFLPRFALRRGELAVAVALALAGCAVPGSGLMREFTQILAMPAYYERITPGWQRTEVISYAPPAMLLCEGTYDEDVSGGYVTGTTGSKKILEFGAVPFRSWLIPLGVWVPIILLSALAVTGASQVVHSQWSRRELLPYPIASFARAVISGRAPGSNQALLGNRTFLAAFAFVFGIRLLNGLTVYYPEYLVPVRLSYDFTPLVQLWPNITRGAGWWWLLVPRVFPTVVAFAFFLSSDVGLSLGLSQLIVVPALALFAGYGYDLQAGQMGTGILSWQMFGSYLAMAGVMTYVGRHHYLRVARDAFLPGLGGAADRAEAAAVWGCRVAAGSCIGLIILFARQGLPWPFAVLLVGLLIMMFTVTARVSAESGLPHVENNWNALGVFLGLFGVAAVGPGAVVVSGLVCAMLMVDVREALMPFLVNGLKICEDEGERPWRVAPFTFAVFAGGFLLAIPVVLAAIYAGGVPLVDGWGSWAAPRFAFDRAQDAVLRLDAIGGLEASEALTPLQRVLEASPSPEFLWAAGIGILLVLSCSFLRLRFARWPLHPVMFLTWSTWPLYNFSHSFLLGWFIKEAVMRLGGQRVYRRCLPAVVGVIAGDILGGLVFMVVGAIYYARTETLAPYYLVFPG